MVIEVVHIAGGSLRGRKLIGPPGLLFRPTTGRVKEFIFSFLGEMIEGSVILDLFSGTGSLGIEALSRGAKKIVFVEQSSESLRLLSRNLKECGLIEKAKIVKSDVFHFLRRTSVRKETFDFIFADPPFKNKLRGKIIKAVDESNILKLKGFLILEHEFHDNDPNCHRLEIIKHRRFGHCVISVYGRYTVIDNSKRY